MNLVVNSLVSLCLILLLGSCVSKTTCWKLVKGGRCIPIQSYSEWNKCVMPCENVVIKSKTKPYKPENNKWVRPRPYVYP